MKEVSGLFIDSLITVLLLLRLKFICQSFPRIAGPLFDNSYMGRFSIDDLSLGWSFMINDCSLGLYLMLDA